MPENEATPILQSSGLGDPSPLGSGGGWPYSSDAEYFVPRPKCRAPPAGNGERLLCAQVTDRNRSLPPLRGSPHL